MSKTTHYLFILALSVSLCAFATDDVQVDVTYQPDHLVFQPQADYDGFTLVVQGEGITLTRTFSGNEYPLLTLTDDDGNLLPDGIYRYELRATPELDSSTRAQMNRAGDDPDERAQLSNQLRLAPFSGNFSVVGGEIINPATSSNENGFGNGLGGSGDESTGVATDLDEGRDIIHTDDVIINGGSLCVGLDCVNGENFGADTIRLKENNLRIHFNDTSNSGSFPTTDWRIVANDQTNGGASYLAFEDSDAGRKPFLVEAGAPSNSLYVDDGGRIGIGTSTPVVELHVVDGDSPTLRLQQDGSSGFTPQTWDVAGNETNWFVRDATNGSPLPLRIRPSAPQNSLYIKEDGNIGLGTSSPSATLDVVGDIEFNDGTLVTTTDGTGYTIENVTGTSATRTILNLRNKGNAFVVVNNTASGQRWNIGVGTDSVFISDNTSSGSASFELKKTGEVIFKRQDNTNIMSIDTNGNMTLLGTLTQNGTPKRGEADEKIANLEATVAAQAAELEALKAQMKLLMEKL